MGRPIKKSFFGNLNQGGSGGEGIASPVVVNSTGSNYSAGSTIVFSNPGMPSGLVATATPVISLPGAGGITGVTITSSGSGYTIPATVSVTVAPTVTKVSGGTTGTFVISVPNTTGIFVGMTVSGDAALGGVADTTKVTVVNVRQVTVSNAHDATFAATTLTFSDEGTGFDAETVLTADRGNALDVYAFVSGGSSGVYGDIVKQESSRRYLVKTAQGTSQCQLVAVATNALVAGQMNIIATDTTGSSYYVTKLTAHKVVLTRQTSAGSGWLFATGETAGWSIQGASLGVVNISNT